MNPLGLKEQDCVIRAICLATNTPYLEVIKLIENNGILNQCDCLNINCYCKLLEDHFNLEAIDGEGKIVKEIAKDNPDKTLIIRVDGHLTSAINGIIFDIWDCTNEKVDVYWIVEK